MTRFDVCSIGNAIVDVLTEAPDTAIAEYELNRGTMTLIDEERADFLTSVMGDRVVEAGGSAGNTAVGLAGLGARSAYIGKVRDDDLGHQFANSMHQHGVHYDTSFLSESLGTARCLIFVTPDGERTMNTYLGASTLLKPQDIDPDVVGESAITYMEGYLWDREDAKAAFRRAMEIAHAKGRLTSLSLSDPFCVERFRAEFLDLVTSGQIDILFANEEELKSLYSTSDYAQAQAAIKATGKLACVTRGLKGSEIIQGQEVVSVPVFNIPKRVDTTGAGDLYAAGFLYGYTSGQSLAECGELASRSGAAVIQRFGARLTVEQCDAIKSNAMETGAD